MLFRSRDIDQAWRELAPSWKLASDTTDPCAAAGAAGVQCYRTGKLTLPLLRQLDRPGILTLQQADAAPGYALLVGLDAQTATLRIGPSLHRIRQLALSRFWRGDFATYWRAPEGYTRDLRELSTGPEVDGLARRLAQLDAGPGAAASAGPQSLDPALRDRKSTRLNSSH